MEIKDIAVAVERLEEVRGGFFDTLQGSSNLAVPMGGGIYVTADGGTNWSRLQSTTGTDWQAVGRIAIDPNDSNVLLAGTMTFLLKPRWSRNAKSWSLPASHGVYLRSGANGNSASGPNT